MKALDRLSASVGVVYVPPALEKQVLTFVLENLFAYWRDSFKKRFFKPNDHEKYKEAWNLLNYFIKKEGITPVKKVKLTKGFIGKEFDIDVDQFPKQYRKLKPAFTSFLVVLFFEKTDFTTKYSRKDSYASFSVTKDNKDKSALMKINLFNLDFMNSHKENPFVSYSTIIDTLRDSVAHELVHAVQDAFLSKFPKQVKMLDQYHENKDNYYLSPIEFAATLKDSINEFVRTYKLVHGHLDRKGEFAPPVQEAIKSATGQLPPDEWFEPSTFLKVLKAKSPKQYKKAIKIFTEEALKRLSDYHWTPTFKQRRFK